MKDLTTCYKIFKDEIFIISLLASVPGLDLRTIRNFSFIYVGLSYKSSFFFNRVVSAWNSIPSCIVNACNPKQFRTRLLSYYSTSG